MHENENRKWYSKGVEHGVYGRWLMSAVLGEHGRACVAEGW